MFAADATIADAWNRGTDSLFTPFRSVDAGDPRPARRDCHIKDLYALLRGRDGGGFVAVSRPLMMRTVYGAAGEAAETVLTRIALCLVVIIGRTLALSTLDNVRGRSGPMQDEYDARPDSVHPQKRGTWEVSGTLPLSRPERSSTVEHDEN